MDDYLAKPVRKPDLHRALSPFAGMIQQMRAYGHLSPVEHPISRFPDPPKEPEPKVVRSSSSDNGKAAEPAEQNGRQHEPIVIGQQHPVIDRELALTNVGGDESLLAAVMESALDEIPTLLPKLRKALDEGNETESQRLAHTIKGAARVIAATKTMKVAEQMEIAAREGDLKTAATGLSPLSTVIDELVETLAVKSKE